MAPDAVFSEGKYKSGLWDLVGQDRMKSRGMTETELHEYYRQRNLLKASVTGRQKPISRFALRTGLESSSRIQARDS